MLSVTFPSQGLSGGSDFVGKLQGRLRESSVSAVNAYLSADWESRMQRFSRITAQCDPEALELAVKLLETTNLEALQAHTESLQSAMARCPSKLLPLVPARHVDSLCDVGSHREHFPNPNDVMSELDRRMQMLARARWVASSANGMACMRAYRAERLEQSLRE